jgi:hypothetical protein
LPPLRFASYMAASAADITVVITAYASSPADTEL